MFWKHSSTSDLLYNIILLLSLVILVITSWNAPLSGDEYVHVKQAEKNINYLKTFGKDKQALDTPISRLKHYGQSFDTITTFVAQVLNIKDLYRFRHVSNAIIAWLTILFSSLVVIKISSDKITGFITVILFLVTMRFMGHAMNNLKDIPFAFAFIFSIYFIMRFVAKLPEISWRDLLFLVLGIAFGISLRIGGLLIFGYFILFSGLYFYYLVVSEGMNGNRIFRWIWRYVAISITVFILSYLLGILLWPWALEDPLANPKESLELMHHYPTTVRQIFEGKLYWSEQFPWYYLFKYMIITLPVIILLGLVFYMILIWKFKNQKGIILSIFILLACGFPLFYASVSGANVYGGWRQILFAFPPLIVLSSLGLWLIYEKLKPKLLLQLSGLALALLFLFNPVVFFMTNYPYQYIFFNPFVGGVQGAYGNYELDYYFTSFKKAYQFIDAQVGAHTEIVAANFIIPEYYKGKPYQPKLIDYYNRSDEDWDYAIICNTFLDPYQLKNELWPPSNTIFTERVNGVPILAILKRPSKLDLEGKKLMDQGEYEAAIIKLKEAMKSDPNNESILINLTRAYIDSNQLDAAQKTIDLLRDIYPNCEWAKDLEGEILIESGKLVEAINIFQQNIQYNYKFYHSYINLAKIQILQGNEHKAIESLKTCLRINPFYIPAYRLYGKLLIDRGEIELGNKMLQYSIRGESKYARQ